MDKAKDKLESIIWAESLLRHKRFCILDTETTGLGETAEVCQIALIDADGKTLMNTLVRPTVAISPKAMEIHGITNNDVILALDFDQVFLTLLKAIGKRELVIYNADYDKGVIRQSLFKHGIYLDLHAENRIVGRSEEGQFIKRDSWLWCNGAIIHCAMEWYAQFVGEWNDYFYNYKWQKLPGGDHTALGDCLATLEVIKKMASCNKPAMQSVPTPEPSLIKPIQQEKQGLDDIPF